MTEVITDTKTFTISISTHGNVKISNVVAPTSVFGGEAFTVSYTTTNTGGSDTCYGKLINTGTSLIIDQWNQVIVTNGIKTTTVNFPSGITTALNAKIDVGYITA